MTGCLRLAHPILAPWDHGRRGMAILAMNITGRMPVPRVVEAEYEKGMLKPSTPLTLRPGEHVPLIVMRQPDPKRWDLSRLAPSPAAEEAFLAEQGLEGWAANLEAEDR